MIQYLVFCGDNCDRWQSFMCIINNADKQYFLVAFDYFLHLEHTLIEKNLN